MARLGEGELFDIVGVDLRRKIEEIRRNLFKILLVFDKIINFLIFMASCQNQMIGIKHSLDLAVSFS
jgi:hypothetical protein